MHDNYMQIRITCSESNCYYDNTYICACICISNTSGMSLIYNFSQNTCGTYYVCVYKFTYIYIL